MITQVYQEFFKRREAIAKLLNFPVNLTGMYYVTGTGAGTYYTFQRMLASYDAWDKGEANSLGYDSKAGLAAGATLRKYFAVDGLTSYSAFYLDGLPGCCGAAHLHDMYSRFPGMGKIMLEIAECAAYFNGYRLLTGTVIEKSAPSIRAAKLIDMYGWQRNRSFVNSRTYNTVYLCSKELTANNAGRRISDGAGKSSNQSSSVKVATVASAAGFST